MPFGLRRAVGSHLLSAETAAQARDPASAFMAVPGDPFWHGKPIGGKISNCLALITQSTPEQSREEPLMDLLGQSRGKVGPTVAIIEPQRAGTAKDCEARAWPDIDSAIQRFQV